jgi:hypothetical protein
MALIKPVCLKIFVRMALVYLTIRRSLFPHSENASLADVHGYVNTFWLRPCLMKTQERRLY